MAYILAGGRLKDNDRIRPVAEDALFQLGESLRRGLEAEAVTHLCSLIQATYLVLSGAGQVNTHTFDHHISPLLTFGLRSNEPYLFPPCL